MNYSLNVINYLNAGKIIKFLVEEAESMDSQQVRKSTEEIQNLVLSLLNQAIADKLSTSILDLRETYLGTLQR